MKNKVLDLAFSIQDFKHLGELLMALNSYSPSASNHEDDVLRGFQLILAELKDDSSLQRNTLLTTMLEVKKQYGMLTMFNHTIEQMSAITLAINHVQYRLKMQRLRVA